MVQSASIPDNNLTKDKHALKQLKNDESIVILPPDKGWVRLTTLTKWMRLLTCLVKVVIVM